MAFTGKFFNPKDRSNVLARRPMTWTDLLFIAANDIVKDKHVYGVGLAHSTKDNETVLITCFVKTSKNT